MKAIILEEFGGPEKLKLQTVENPIPKDNEVLIKISHAGINPVDWKIREGLLKDRLPHIFPIIPGWDASGIIVGLGKSVHDLKIGDEVYTYARKPTVGAGTYAEFVCVDVDHVVAKPRSLTFSQAAAIPLSGLTAWQALFDDAKLKAGETLLVLGGSGGVGSLAIQFAKSMGATVLATASPHKQDYIKHLGADVGIDHTRNIVDQVHAYSKDGVDVVFDCFGKEAFKSGIACLKKGGRIVSLLEHLDPSEAARLGIKASYLFVVPNGGQLKQIANLIDSGKVVSQPVEEIPLADAAIAQEKLRSGTITGKLTLKIS